MNRFIHIDPQARSISQVHADQPHEVFSTFDSRLTDHGTVIVQPKGGIGIIVYEYGLLEGDGPYFSILSQLYAGHAILYAFDETGETIDMPDAFWSLPVHWHADKAAVENAIFAGRVIRPQAKINGQLVWSWNVTKGRPFK